MQLPFGIQLKGLIVGVVLALFVWPWISGKFLSGSSRAEA